MSRSDYLLYLIPLGALTYVLGTRFCRKNIQLSPSPYPCLDDLDDGPKPSSWLGGTITDLIGPANVGDKDQEYIEKFGTVFKAKGTFGRSNTLYLADPHALNYVLNTRGYTFDRGSQLEFARIVVGSNLLTSEHEDHARQRKILLPGFSQPSIRDLLPAFIEVTEKLISKWMDLCENSTESRVINVHNWFSRLTLDAVGRGVFAYDFGALGDSPSEYLKTYTAIFNDAQKKPGSEKKLGRTLAILDIGALLLPLWLLRPVGKIFMNTKIIKDFQSAAKAIAMEIIEKEKKAATIIPEGKDILSILVRSNLTEDVKLKMSDDDLVGQLIVFTIAAHDTTSTTLSWLFYQLSRHLDYQNRMREEIVQFRNHVGSKELSSSDYESLPLTTAAIKETLRFHPVAGHNVRFATKDEVIPLSQTVGLRNGSKSDQIFVKTGQSVILGFSAYNRLKELWGEDANEWNPERFLGERANLLPKSSIGVYANLSSFSSGVHSCIGWRFAVLQLHVVALLMVENFMFSPEPDSLEIYTAPITGMLPFVKGREKEGPQLPLSVTPVS